MTEPDKEVQSTDRRQSQGTQSDPPVSADRMGAREKNLKVDDQGLDEPKHGDATSRET